MAGALLSPMVASALVLLFVNDRWLKYRWPGLVTGKLSDVAGLVFFPILLAGLVEVVVRYFGRRTPALGTLYASTALTALVFAVVKLSSTAASVYSDALGWIQWPVRAVVAVVAGHPVPPHVPILVRADPWDLVALPALALSVVLARRWVQRAPASRRAQGIGSGVLPSSIADYFT